MLTKKIKMNKEELLQNAIDQGKQCGFISWDGMLDLCDEDSELIEWLTKQLEQLSSEGKLEFELDF